MSESLRMSCCSSKDLLVSSFKTSGYFSIQEPFTISSAFVSWFNSIFTEVNLYNNRNSLTNNGVPLIISFLHSGAYLQYKHFTQSPIISSWRVLARQCKILSGNFFNSCDSCNSIFPTSFLLRHSA